MYEIEAVVNGQWVGDAVGAENSFETEAEAEEMIPALANVFQCAETEFRVVER